MGVALLRQTLRKAMRDVQEGRDPQNLLRDPAQNHALETSCWNTVMTPEQFEQVKQTMPAEAGRRQAAPALQLTYLEASSRDYPADSKLETLRAPGQAGRICPAKIANPMPAIAAPASRGSIILLR
jgi:hypothetical protein